MHTSYNAESNQSRFALSLSIIASTTRSVAKRYVVTAAMTSTALILSAPNARAQSAHFGGAQFTSQISFVSYGGVLVDPSGDVFMADDQNRQIVEFTPAGKTVELPLGGGEPQYMALDKANSLYVTTTTPAQVVKLPLSNGVYGVPTVIANSFTQPWGIAVDSKGNVFVADHATSIIYELSPNSLGYKEFPIVNFGYLNAPVQMAIDSSNNLYVADQGNNRVVSITPGGSIRTPFKAVSNPSGVAVDLNGNVAVTGNAGLTYEALNRGNYTATLIASNFTTPYGVAFDKNGNMYVDDDHARQLVMQTPMTASFGSVQVGNESASLSLAFVFDSNAGLGSPNPVQFVQNGAASQMYMSLPGSTCTASQLFLMGQTCTANVMFKPLEPGVWSANLNLMSWTSSLLATAPLTGSGFYPPPTGGGGCAVKPLTRKADAESQRTGHPSVCF